MRRKKPEHILSCCRKIPLFRGVHLTTGFTTVTGCFCRIIMLSPCRGRSRDNVIVRQSQFLSASACYCRIAVLSGSIMGKDKTTEAYIHTIVLPGCDNAIVTQSRGYDLFESP